MRELSAFFDNEPDPATPDGERFEMLLTLTEAYEAKHFSADLPDPVGAAEFRMEQGGLTAKDLEPMIGRPIRVYEVLNRKRPLTLPTIRKLHAGLGIPTENLIRPPRGVPAH
jgi:HTH-type transcriptional regulator / antitoxin HigA